MSQAGKYTSGGTPPIGTVLTLEGNSGGPVGPDGGGNIFVVGSGAMDIAGNPGTNTLTVNVATASTAQLGVVELATNAETITGTDATRAATPASLSAKLGSQTIHTVALGDGATNSLNWTNAGTDGQVLIGATGADPAFATLTSTGGTVIFTPGPNSLNLEASGGSGSGITVTADTGSAAPIANVLTLKGAVGGNISTVGSSNNLTVAVSGTTNHAVQVGNSTGSLTSVGPGTTNTVLLGNTGANPSFGQVPNGALVNNSITFNNGNSISCSPTGPVALGSGVTIGVSGTSPHAVQVGAVAGGLANIAVGTTNTVLLGNTGANPSFGQVPNGALVNSSITVTGDQNITVTGSPVSLGGTVNLAFPDVNQYELVTANGSGAVESLPAGTGTSGQVLTSNGAGAYPTWQSVGAGSSVIVTEFTSSGTWTKNPATKVVAVLAIGAGSGGGSGGIGATGFNSGGGGGSGGGGVYVETPASFFGASESVIVGAAGSGGAARLGISGAGVGNPGTAGGVSSVGNMSTGTIASMYGQGGSTGSSSGVGGGLYPGAIGQYFGPTTFGGGPGYIIGAPFGTVKALAFAVTGGGGGSGGVAASTVTPIGAGISVVNLSLTVILSQIGGNAGGDPNGPNGYGRQTSGGIAIFGTGGSGGAGCIEGSTLAGRGGNAGGYGCGGGGGGGATTISGTDSGAGGNGSPGIVIITEYL